jgi:hypothetical protein
MHYSFLTLSSREFIPGLVSERCGFSLLLSEEAHKHRNGSHTRSGRQKILKYGIVRYGILGHLVVQLRLGFWVCSASSCVAEASIGLDSVGWFFSIQLALFGFWDGVQPLGV